MHKDTLRAALKTLLIVVLGRSNLNALLSVFLALCSSSSRPHVTIWDCAILHAGLPLAPVLVCSCTATSPVAMQM